jgi:hypothetical protein
MQELENELYKLISNLNENLEELKKQKNKDRWIPITKLSRYLGEGFQYDSIRNKIKEGKLKYGVHYIDVSEKDSERKSYLVNPLQIENYYSVPPEFR